MPITKTVRLHVKDDRHHSATCEAVEQLRYDTMHEINKQRKNATGEDMPIADFWNRFVAHCEEIWTDGRPRRKPSTMRGYKQIWEQHLKAHFGKKTLQGYRTEQGELFLDNLSAKLGRRTIEHIRGVASSLFARAKDEHRISVNPWTNMKMPETPDPADTQHYTWAEAEAVISALSGRVDHQLILALSCYMGLRPNEIAGLRWEDIDTQWLHVRRGVVSGRVDKPKTRSSKRDLPLLMPVVTILLNEWRRQSTGDGWVFPNGGTLTAAQIIAPEMRHYIGGPTPVNLPSLCRHVITPKIIAAGLQWKPLKCGRTGAATEIIHRTGNTSMAQAMLGHQNLSTTLKTYKMPMSKEELAAAMMAGMKALSE